MFLKNCPYSNFLFRNLHLHFLNTALTAALRQARLFTSVTSFDVLKVESRLHDFLQTIFFVPFKNGFSQSVNEQSKFRLKSRCALILSINIFTLHCFFVSQFCLTVAEAADLSCTETTWRLQQAYQSKKMHYKQVLLDHCTVDQVCHSSYDLKNRKTSFFC